MRSTPICRALIALAAVAMVACSHRRATMPDMDTAYNPVDASGFRILANDSLGMTLIEVYNPWQGAEDVTGQLLIVSNPDDVPRDYTGQVIYGPAKRIVAMSSTYVAMLDELGLTDRIVGVSGREYIHNPTLRSRGASVLDVGNETNVDFETMLMADPDLVLIYGVNGVSAMEPKLRELELPFLYIPDYLEQSPTGKAEWIVVVGAVTGHLDEAKAAFSAIRERYNALAAKVADVEQRPTVMFNTPYNDAWFMPSADNYAVRLIHDAGGSYIYPQNVSARSEIIDTEKAYMLAATADYWLNPGTLTDLAALRSALPHFADIPTVDGRRVYNNNLRSTSAGGNDFYESGAMHPDRVLADLITILHPELSDSTLYYYRQLR